MATKKYDTNYLVAVNWCNNHRVMCNNIPEIDPSVWDNMQDFTDEADVECPECGSSDVEITEYGWGASCECNDCGHEWDDDEYEAPEKPEIFQWFITDCSEWDVKFLREHFGLLFTYSDLLDCYILCVTHYGTAWDYVHWSTDIEYAECKLGEGKN